MFYLVQAGSSLQAVQSSGAVTTLTLPAGVTIDPTLTGRFAVLGQQIVFVGASTVNLWIDPRDLTVRKMGIEPPLNVPTIAAGSGAGLTGAYRVGVSFAIKNVDGEIVNQSPVLGPGIAIVLTNQDRLWTLIPVSPNPDVNCRILYSTASGGTDLFEMLEIDDNVTTTIEESTPDASLDVLPAPSLGIPPGSVPGTSLTQLIEWKSRLWAVSGRYDERDDVLFTELDQFYAWPAENFLPAYPKGEDAFGVTGFIRRRDALGICKRARVMKVIGSSPDDFEVVILAEGPGCVSADTVVVIRDKGYFLGLDGVYRWDDSGVVCISRDAVDPWFTTDNYFQRSRFPLAFGGWNPVSNAYELCLANLGDSVENRWVSFHLDANDGKGEWLGPHLTSAFTPTCRGRLQNDTGLYTPVIGGSDGYLYLQNQTVFSDVSGAAVSSAISARLDTKYHSGNAPNVTHYWGQLSVLNRVEAGGTLTVTPVLGRLGAFTTGAALSVDLTLSRTRARRLGVGPLCGLSFTQATATRGFLLFGYELPVQEVGVR